MTLPLNNGQLALVGELKAPYFFFPSSPNADTPATWPNSTHEVPLRILIKDLAQQHWLGIALHDCLTWLALMGVTAHAPLAMFPAWVSDLTRHYLTPGDLPYGSEVRILPEASRLLLLGPHQEPMLIVEPLLESLYRSWLEIGENPRKTHTVRHVRYRDADHQTRSVLCMPLYQVRDFLTMTYCAIDLHPHAQEPMRQLTSGANKLVVNACAPDGHTLTHMLLNIELLPSWLYNEVPPSPAN